ncbi:xaa-Pro aminopeptidase 3-like isoform X2 [Lineus longissimus]
MKRIMDSGLGRTFPDMDHLVVFTSAPKLYMSIDVPYFYRQNTEFLYMSGFIEADSVLLLHSQKKLGSGFEEVMFVTQRNASKELWEGPSAGVEGGRDLLGIQNVKPLDHLDRYLANYLKDSNKFCLWYEYLKPVNQKIHSNSFLPLMKEANRVETPTKIVHHQRLMKSTAEIELMRKSNRIASEAFVEVMKFTKPWINESALFAKMDFECRIHGAEYLAYPPVVAGGNRANTIHYISNNQVIADGELVLMDAGCEYHGYCSDITRTWPVTGNFSPAQRDLYSACLIIQELCIQMCRPGVTLEEIYRAMLAIMGEQLKKLGLIPSSVSASDVIKLTRQFCAHHVGHYLGMDVHDSAEVGRNLALQPGMIITIEPGIYISATRNDVDPKYRGIGIRIEDNILITETGHENLTANCPKDPDVIEQIITDGKS